MAQDNRESFVENMDVPLQQVPDTYDASSSSSAPDHEALRGRPTMQDVAASAGVSLKTVSRVVNNEPSVNEKTRERVNKAILQLGFRRNDLASSLRRGRSSSTIGLVIEDITNPFYSKIARGLEEVAQRYNYMLIISNSGENAARERELVNALLRRRVDGLCIVPAGLDHSYLTPEVRLGTPVLFLDRPPIHVQTDIILLDNRGGAYKATQHLLSYGHRRIAMIQGDPQVFTGAERLQGYSEALQDHHIPYDEALVRFGCDDALKAAHATHSLMTLPDPPTALFTSSNRISITVLRELRAYSQKLAFVGFDDFELADMLPLPVTVITHDPIDMGCKAAELLFARLHGDTRPPQHLTIPTELITRGSGELPPP